MSTMLALTYDESFSGEEVVGSWAGTVQSIKEFAGRSFFDRYELSTATQAGGSDGDDDSQSRAAGSEDGAESPSKKKANKQKVEGLKLSDNLKDKDLYKLLEVTEGCSDQELKKSYRNMVLQHHPDKKGADVTEADRLFFISIQEAYELLSDPARRKRYDSMQEFNDDIPNNFNKFRDDFYKEFGPVFERNSRWSGRRPVPQLGTPETPMAEVKKFYNFWYEFENTRDPAANAEMDGQEFHDLEDAECREERRWMERENAKIARVYKKHESQRVASLVKLAEKFDPRMIAEKEAKQAAKDAQKAAAQAEREAADRAKKEKAEAIAKAAAEKDAAEKEKKRKEKEAKDAARAATREARTKLRDLIKAPELAEAIHVAQFNEFIGLLPTEECIRLREETESTLGKGGAVQVLHDALLAKGLSPIKPEPEEDVSTTTGQEEQEISEDETDEARAARLKREEKERIAEAKRKEEQAAIAAKKAAEKAAEKAKREAEAEKKKAKEAAKEAAAVKKAEERARKEQEKAAQKAEELRLKEEENKRKQQEAAKAAAEAKKQAAEEERQAKIKAKELEWQSQIFEEQRTTYMDSISDEAMLASVKKAVEIPGVEGALAALKKLNPEEEEKISRCALILREAGAKEIDLAFPAPPQLTVTTALRNKMKKLRMRVRKCIATVLSESYTAAKKVHPAYKAIVDGSVEAVSDWKAPPTPAEILVLDEPKKVEAEEEAAAPVAEAAAPKKGKKKAAPKAEEDDLDAILADMGLQTQADDKKKKKKAKK